MFERFPNTIMHIDLKGDSPQLPVETYKLVKAYKRENITVNLLNIKLIFLDIRVSQPKENK